MNEEVGIFAVAITKDDIISTLVVKDEKIKKVIEKNILNFLEVCDKELGCYTFESYLYSYIKSSDHIFVCVSGKNVSTYATIQLLQDIDRAKQAGDKAFLLQKINEYNDMPKDRIKKIEKELDEIKEIAIGNIKKLEERGVKIESLQSQVEELEKTTVEFQTGAVNLKKAACLNSLRAKILLGVGILVVVAVIVIIIVAEVCANNKCAATPAPAPK